MRARSRVRTDLGRCSICGDEGPLISSALGACATCIKERPEESMPVALRAHSGARSQLGLPGVIPDDGDRTCQLCPNHCSLDPGEIGFCGLRENRSGIVGDLLGKGQGLAHLYPDPHPTNCVASWCCAGGSRAGYPEYSVCEGAEIGWRNAAVFLGACTFHCLYCQNHRSWRAMIGSRSPLVSEGKLAGSILDDPSYTCLCWFGGCPSAQPNFVLSTSKLVSESKGDRILRICLETNGNFEPRPLRSIAEISLESGGGLKFDLKFNSTELHRAICGAPNEAVLQNFRSLKPLNSDRPDPPFLRASTLLVPGYTDPGEIASLARLIAEVDTDIPYSLLAFEPEYVLADLPRCTWRYVEDCRRAALSAGLTRVNIGNRFLID